MRVVRSLSGDQPNRDDRGRASQSRFMSDITLTLLVLRTRQVEQLRAFYQTLGVDLVEEQHGKGSVHFAGRAGDVVIEVYPFPDDGNPVESFIRLGFAVENVAEVIQALEGIGIKIVTPPKETAW